MKANRTRVKAAVRVHERHVACAHASAEERRRGREQEPQTRDQGQAQSQLLPPRQNLHPLPHTQHDAIDALEARSRLVLAEQALSLLGLV